MTTISSFRAPVLATLLLAAPLFSTACATEDPDDSADVDTEVEAPAAPTGIATELSSPTGLNCAGNVTLCAFAAAGFALTCAANVWATGTLTVPCASAFAATGGACAIAADTCTGGSGGSGTPTVRRLGLIGGTPGTGDVTTDLSCADTHRANRMQVWWGPNAYGNTRVTKVSLGCTDGKTLTWGINNGTNNYTYQCSKGDLFSGLRVRSGQEIDAIGAICRQVASSDPHTYYTVKGGTGGTLSENLCPAGKYVSGLKVTRDAASETNPNIVGLSITCR